MCRIYFAKQDRKYIYISQFPSAIGWRKKKEPAIIIKQQFGFPMSTT